MDIRSAVVATVCPPTKKIGYVSNCIINYTSNVLTMVDDTSRRPFEQKAHFDAIAPNFESFLGRVPPDGKFRIVSFCSEFSILTAATIKDYCLKLALIRFPPNSRESQFISLGFVYDSSVRDFLSLEDTDSQMFEMIETFDSAEMIDLLQCGLEKLRRIKDSVFVMRIGSDDNFFEWVIVPRTDSYVPSPSMAGLPANEKLFYILNLLSSSNEQSIERFTRASSIFKLVSDSFCDVPTFWVFHLAEESTLKSNAALCRVASMLLKVKDFQINYYPTNLFYVKNEADNAASSVASEEYINSLSKEELEDLDYLRAKVGGEAFLSSSRKSSSRKSYRLHGSDFPEGEFIEEEEGYEYEYSESEYEEQSDGSILRKPRRKNKLKRKKKEKKEDSQPTKSIDELRAEEEERRRKEEEQEEERRKAIELLRQSRPKKDDSPSKTNKKKSKGVKNAKSIIASSQTSKMSRRDKVSERIAKLKQLRALEEEDEEEEEEDTSELRELKKNKNLTEEERYMREMKKRLKNRQNKFTKISILATRAQRAAKDRNATIETIEDLQRQVTQALEEAEQFRADAKDEISYLKDTLAYRRKKHEQNQKDIRDIRHDYLERHCENVEEIDKRKRKEARKKAELAKTEKEGNSTSRKDSRKSAELSRSEKEGINTTRKDAKKNAELSKNEKEADIYDPDFDLNPRPKKGKQISFTNRSPEYEMAIMYLEEEIEQVKKEISVLIKKPTFSLPKSNEQTAKNESSMFSSKTNPSEA